MRPTFLKKVMEVLVQLVIVMPRVPAIYSVLIQLGNVLAMPVIKEPNVMLLVVVIQQVQVAQHVMLLQVNVLVKLDTPEQHVTHVLPTITKQAMELVQVSNTKR